MVADDPAEGLGPLAGVLAALRWARSLESRWVQLVSGDTPFIPLDLSVRLQAALSDGCDLAVPESGGRLHHLCGLWRVDQLAGLSAFIDAGGRAVHEWAESRSFVTVRFDDASVDPFFNINTADDLARAERLAAGADVL